MTRPGFLLITAVAVILGCALSIAFGSCLDWARGITTLVLALLLHAGANVMNDYHDALNGADAGNTQGLFPFTGGSRHIQNGTASIGQTRLLGYTLLILVILPGLLLSALTGPGLLLIGLTGVLLAWAYSSPPFSLMSRGLGELAVGVAWWLVVLGAYYVQRRDISFIPAATSLSYAALVINILLINEIPDAASDTQAGKRTLATRLGPTGTCALYLVIAFVAHTGLLTLIWAGIAPAGAIGGMASLPLSIAGGMLFWRERFSSINLRLAIVLSISSTIVHGLGLCFGLLTRVFV